MPTINPERLGLALDRLDHRHGWIFESFANAFLASEFPGLRAVAGMHDGGRDAFLHAPDGEPTVYIQHSVTEKWDEKIRKTVTTLRDNGFTVVQLVYCTPRDVERHASVFKRALRKDGIVVDIRDRNYFITHCNTSMGCVATAEDLAKQMVDPLLVEKQIIATTSSLLNSDEERAAVAYLQLSLAERDPSKALTKFSYDALAKYVLRHSIASNAMPRSEVHRQLRNFIAGVEDQTFRHRVNGSLERLVESGYLKLHSKEDAFATAHTEHVALQSKLTSLAASRATAVEEAADIVALTAEELAIDYQFPIDRAAEDALTLAERFLFEQGKAAAEAFHARRFYLPNRDSLVTFAERALANWQEGFASLQALGPEKFLDIVPSAAARIISHPTGTIRRRLSHAVDAYWLLFVLRQTADVQSSLNKLIGNSTLLVDASILVPCLAEEAFPDDERPMRTLLLAAADADCKLIVTQDVIDELLSHLKAARYMYYNPGIREPELTRAFRDRQRDDLGSFEEFLSRFVGDFDPAHDLKEYLEAELRVTHDSLIEAYSAIKPEEFEAILQEWKEQRRGRPDLGDEHVQLLASHDVRALLAVEVLRHEDKGADALAYGHRWWWLTLDRTAYRVDAVRNRQEGGASVCMSPEFFNRYLSVAPKSSAEGARLAERLPLSVEVMELDLVPPSVATEAAAAMAALKDAPEYRKRRRLRELLITARQQSKDDARQR